MGAESYKLLVNSNLVSPDSTLGKQTVLVGGNLCILKRRADLCLQLIAIANGILERDLLNLVGIGANKLKLCLNVALDLCALALTHLNVACDSLVKHRAEGLPLCLKIFLSLVIGEDVLIASNTHNADVVLKSKLVAESVKSRNIALKVCCIKTNVAKVCSVIVNGDENVNLTSCNGICLDVLLNAILKEEICSGKLYCAIKKSGVYTLKLNSNILFLALALCSAVGGHRLYHSLSSLGLSLLLGFLERLLSSSVKESISWKSL